MSKYPKINYIGNKNKLTDWIVDKQIDRLDSG